MVYYYHIFAYQSRNTQRQAIRYGNGEKNMVEVKIQSLNKRYTKNSEPVLKDLSLTVNAGERFFLLGPSGCGKSTLLRIIAGLLAPDSGKIFFNGSDVTGLAPEKRRSPMVFQNYALWPAMTVEQNVLFALEALKLPAKERRERAAQALAAVQMETFASRHPGELSGGQQQRVALARCLASAPGLILLDEPLSNLDSNLREEMRRELLNICKDRNLTSIYVTHDRREALGMADRIALLKDGEIAALGTPEDIYRRPRTRFAAGFMGDANFISGKVSASGKVVTEFGELETDDTGFAVSTGAAATLCLRPESIITGEGVAFCPNRFTLTVASARFEGERTALEFTCGLRASDTTGATFTPGMTIEAGCKASALSFITDGNGGE